jgi:hypothetical protein
MDILCAFDESVTISCTNHDPEDVVGVGKLALDTGCKGYTSFAFLQTKVQVKSKGIKGQDLLSRIHSACKTEFSEPLAIFQGAHRFASCIWRSKFRMYMTT